MITISWTVIDLGTSLDTAVWTVSANGLSSILTIFLQILPFIVIFSIMTFLPERFTGLFDWFSFWKSKSKSSSSSSSFEWRQRESKTVLQDDRYKTNSEIWWY